MGFYIKNKDEVTRGNIERSIVKVPNAEQWEMQSSAEKRKYQIIVHVPSIAAPPTGYPVIYLLDGNSVFATMVEALRMQCHRPDKTGVVPAVIVGIGYQTNLPFAPDRYYDFTSIPTTEFSHTSDGTLLPKQGGAAAFLTFIEEELKPQIESEFNINKSRQAIFGHSLGGLFALYVLFTKPSAFQSYIAGSPSIHWNKKIMFEAEQKFISCLERSHINAELLIGMGELEKQHVSRNYDHAKKLSDRLAAQSNRGVNVKFAEFEGEGHTSVLPVLISRALRFALKPEK
ncbi:alpha/beta hydrolase [Sporosarcina sp. FSL K6-3457]|uniref:alpha/beta hydrolase n=1 Tax=Sporosarcina sp. FSL K6-3457 TaxID=2978204 RepID=UPI004046DFD8